MVSGDEASNEGAWGAGASGFEWNGSVLSIVFLDNTDVGAVSDIERALSGGRGANSSFLSKLILGAERHYYILAGECEKEGKAQCCRRPVSECVGKFCAAQVTTLTLPAVGVGNLLASIEGKLVASPGLVFVTEVQDMFLISVHIFC